jgi:hypothetical protein
MGFDLTGLGAVFNMGSKIIDKIWPDKAEAERAKIELFKMTQAGEFKELEAEIERARMQVDVNIAEAQSGSLFKGGWRPFAGWVCGFGMMYSVLLQPLATGFIRAFVPDSAAFVMPDVDTSVLMTLLLGMLGLGGMRTFERNAGKIK